MGPMANTITTRPPLTTNKNMNYQTVKKHKWKQTVTTTIRSCDSSYSGRIRSVHQQSIRRSRMSHATARVGATSAITTLFQLFRPLRAVGDYKGELAFRAWAGGRLDCTFAIAKIFHKSKRKTYREYEGAP